MAGWEVLVAVTSMSTYRVAACTKHLALVCLSCEVSRVAAETWTCAPSHGWSPLACSSRTFQQWNKQRAPPCATCRQMGFPLPEDQSEVLGPCRLRGVQERRGT